MNGIMTGSDSVQIQATAGSGLSEYSYESVNSVARVEACLHLYLESRKSLNSLTSSAISSSSQTQDSDPTLPPGAGTTDDQVGSAGSVLYSDDDKSFKNYSVSSLSKDQSFDFVLIPQATWYIIRIARVLQLPHGHTLLLGLKHSGRHRIIKLVCYILNLRLLILELGIGETKKKWREGFKEAVLSAGLESDPERQATVLFVKSHPAVDYSVLNDFLNDGWSPGLLEDEDLDRINDTFHSHGASTPEQAVHMFISVVKLQLRVVLSLSSLPSSLSPILSTCPALCSQCSLQWFDDFSQDNFECIAEAYFENSRQIEILPDLKEKELRKTLAAVFSEIHTGVVRTVEELKLKNGQVIYHDMTSFQEVLLLYVRCAVSRRDQLGMYSTYIHTYI